MNYCATTGYDMRSAVIEIGVSAKTRSHIELLQNPLAFARHRSAVKQIQDGRYVKSRFARDHRQRWCGPRLVRQQQDAASAEISVVLVEDEFVRGSEYVDDRIQVGVRQSHNTLLDVSYAVPNIIGFIRVPGRKIDVTGAIRCESVPGHPHRC